MLYSTLISLFQGRGVDINYVIAAILSSLFVIFLILPLHEFAHGFVAKKLGDPTAKWEGRLTLNPLASVDPMGSLCLLLFGFGWAKPVPVDSRYFKKPKRDMAIVAAAGPVSNFLAALVGALLLVPASAYLGLQSSSNMFIAFLLSFLNSYIAINISLAAFNLLPIPPLDGSRIVAAFLSDRAMYKYYQYQNIIMMGLFLLVMMGALSGPLSIIQSALANFVMTIARLPYQLFGIV